MLVTMDTYWCHALLFLLVVLAAGTSETEEDAGTTTYTTCHCKDGTDCDQTTRLCPTSECDVGWSGDNCSLVCAYGNYGEGCNETCDRCESRDCDHLHGACLRGCVQGWDGEYCDQKIDEDAGVPMAIILVAVLVVVVLIGLALITAYICYRKRKRRLSRIKSEDNPDNLKTNLPLDVAYNAIKAVEVNVEVDDGRTKVFDNDINVDLFHNNHPDQVTEL